MLISLSNIQVAGEHLSVHNVYIVMMMLLYVAVVVARCVMIWRKMILISHENEKWLFFLLNRKIIGFQKNCNGRNRIYIYIGRSPVF